jgi:hypothetical protein
MKNFKEIAEKCLAGKLSGTFVIQGEKNWHSSALSRHMIAGHEMPGQYVIGPGVIYNVIGQCASIERIRIIDFIPDNTQEQIKIDIPEGKVPVMEQTEKGVVITWKEKELTYDIIESKLNCCIPSFKFLPNLTSISFYNKVEVLRKLTNIRNYFGKSTDDKGYGIFYHEYYKKFYVDVVGPFSPVHVCFSTKEHAEQAIKMLGDELKYLFEPW